MSVAGPVSALTLQATGFASVPALGLRSTTGGASGPTVVVDTLAELKSSLQGNSPVTIAIQGSIVVDDFGDELSVGSNKTILGLGADAELVYGGFNINNQSNIIIRNLTIRDSYVEGDWDGKTQDYDGIQVDDSHHIWIDHVHVTRMGDGLIDLRGGGLDYVTVSNSILSNHNKAFGVGWTDESDQHVTIHHNWIHDTNQRNPAFDNVIGHFYNNLLEDIDSYGLNPRGNAVVVSENNIFDGVNRPYLIADNAELVATGDVMVNSPNASPPHGDAFDPNEFYEYTLDDTDGLRDWIMGNAGPQASIGVLPIPGDFNQDGAVDIADYTIWRDNLGAPAATLPGAGSTGTIGVTQYETWRTNFGQAAMSMSSTSGMNVPEPTSSLLVLFLGWMLASIRAISKQTSIAQ